MGETMILKDLLTDLQYDCLQGDLNRQISEIVIDSRKAVAGSVFVCLSGALSDGHDYALEAVQRGAVALVVERPIAVADEVTVIQLSNTRYGLALMSAAYFGHPQRELKTIAITGTKGKTTTSYFIKSILQQAGYKVGIIGTNGIDLGGEFIAASLTTPESHLLHHYFRRMVDNGCQYLVMEVSSQALMLDRSAGIEFDVAIFTNLSRDHIGGNEHRDYDHYKYCKSLLFQQCRLAIGNKDDEAYGDMFSAATCPQVSYGQSPTADYCAHDINFANRNRHFISFALTTPSDTAQISLGRLTEFDIYNALAAIACCRELGVSYRHINQALKTAQVAGRFEMLKLSERFLVIIDYAHNGVSLDSLLSEIRKLQFGRIVTIFGCGGNRSKNRRYDMGEVSGKRSDFTVITSDNARFENPNDIIADIITGIEKTAGQYIAIVDRKAAIHYAIKNAQDGDCIVIAGRGHEKINEVNGVKHQMEDKQLVKEVVLELQGQIADLQWPDA